MSKQIKNTGSQKLSSSELNLVIGGGEETIEINPTNTITPKRLPRPIVSS